MAVNGLKAGEVIELILEENAIKSACLRSLSKRIYIPGSQHHFSSGGAVEKLT